MRGFLSARPPLNCAEAGGILIGQYRGPHVEIVECTMPMARDVRTRFAFDRIDPGHGDRAKDAWERSGRVQTFVGEWHTHPVERPNPSCIDLRSWTRGRKKSQGDPLVFMIFGSIGVWCGLGQQDELIPLDPVY